VVRPGTDKEPTILQIHDNKLHEASKDDSKQALAIKTFKSDEIKAACKPTPNK